MALSLKDIKTGTLERPPRIVLLGVEKIGKSTWAAGAPAPVFITARGEEGVDSLNVAQFPPARRYEDVIDALGSLYQEAHEFGTVVIDSLSMLEPLVWDMTCRANNTDSIERVGGGFGKGYVEALRYWRDILDGLDALRNEKQMGVILVGHVKVKAFNDPTADPYDCYMADVHERAANTVYRWADFIGFASGKSIVKTTDAGFNKKAVRAVGTNQRVLHTQKRPAHPGGGRGVYGRLPYELPLEYAAFAAAVEAANQTP